METTVSLGDIFQINAGLLSAIAPSEGQGIRIAQVLENFDRQNVQANIITNSAPLANLSLESISGSYAGRLSTAFPLSYFGRTVAVESNVLEQRFHEQADRWERETSFMSSTPKRVLHPSYQAIIAMGPDVIPILLRDLQKTRRSWFWALRYLAGVDPVESEDRGRLDKMVSAWVEWGKKEGKL